MNICFGGQSTREKILFMCYLGVVISKSKKVVVQTNEKHFFTSADTVFFGDNLTVTTRDMEAEIVIKESDEKGDFNFFVYDLLGKFPLDKKDSEKLVSLKDVTYIFINNTSYSKINKKYLMLKFGITDEEVHFLPLDEGDISKNIENCFEETLSIKGLSRNYKDALISISKKVLSSDVRETRKLFKLALRSC